MATHPLEPERKDNILQIDEMRIDLPQRALPWTKLYKCTNCFIHHNMIRTRGAFAGRVSTGKTDTCVCAAGFFYNNILYILVKFAVATSYYVMKNDGTGGTTLAATPASQVYIPKFFEFNGVFYCTDYKVVGGIPTLYKFYYNGSAFVSNYNGIYGRPVGATFDADSGGTVPAATYYYVYTYRNTLSPNIVESIYSQITGHTLDGSHSANLRVTASSDSQVDTYRVYRSTSTTGPFYFLQDYPVSGGVVLNDNNTNTNPLIIADNVRHYSPTFTCVDLFSFKQRLMYLVLNSNLLYYSEPNEPEHLSNNYLQIGEPNDYNVGGVQFDTYAIVFKQRSIWVFEGEDPSSFRTYKIADEGCFSEHSVRKINNLVYYQNEYGYNTIDQYGRIERIDDTVYPAVDGSIAIGNNAIVRPDAYHDKIWLLHHDGAYQTNGAVDRAWVYDPLTKKIVGKLTFTSCQWIFFANGSLYATISTGGTIYVYIYTLDMSDVNAQTFNTEIETGYRYMEHLLVNHQRQIKVLQDKNSSDESWTVKVNVDGTLSSSLGTFKGSDSGIPLFRSDQGGQFLAINLSATAIRKVISITGFEITAEPTVIE